MLASSVSYHDLEGTAGFGILEMVTSWNSPCSPRSDGEEAHKILPTVVAGSVLRGLVRSDVKVAGDTVKGKLSWPWSDKVAESWPVGSAVRNRVAVEGVMAADDDMEAEGKDMVAVEGGLAGDEDVEAVWGEGKDMVLV